MILKKLFTHEEQLNNFIKYGKFHIFVIIFMFAFMYYCHKRKKDDKFEKAMIYIIFATQILLYGWYATGELFLIDGLPLYTCRIAGVALVIAYFFKSSLLKSLGVYLGIVGGIVALFTPALYPYRMYHFTNINFFVFHLLLLGLSTYHLSNDEGEVIYKNRRRVQALTGVILIGVALVNHFVGSNYSYTASPPIFTTVAQNIKWIIYFIVLLFLYELSIYLESVVIRIIAKRKKAEEEEEIHEYFYKDNF
ncbi:TIGR02206 family membrane protein [Peptoniphilus sp. oral taxon 386]|uniref:YwaF family protein n=1 Tax=Peptoniphilus sp. oral taxon 386 TaxID=652713 RepID=UPI0001DA9F66|nr:TIGR02206 family membrane protein [Peptoniphilus sp. oral taxon 386]EFI41565.1 TIGR02206 family protein [Peptoniphilus sp. oral taxon 386 str. F0131]